MNEFDQFIDSVLNDRGINEEDKKELEIELRDHLNCLKKDFIEKGHNEIEANKLAVKEFGEVNVLGNTLKRYLVSKNKVRTLTNSNKIKGILVMLITYFITTLFYVIVINKTLVGGYNILVAFVSVASIYVYINIKLRNKENKLNSLRFFVIVFFIIERMMMFLAIGVTTYLRGGDFWHTHIINISYTLSYIVFSGVAIWRIKFDRSTMLDRVRNPYDSKVMTAFLVSISIILNVVYYLFPNRWYALCVLMEKLVGESIDEVSKNLLYLIINDSIIIPNIGILILIGLVLIVFYKVIRKGVKSII